MIINLQLIFFSIYRVAIMDEWTLYDYTGDYREWHFFIDIVYKGYIENEKEETKRFMPFSEKKKNNQKLCVSACIFSNRLTNERLEFTKWNLISVLLFILPGWHTFIEYTSLDQKEQI